MKYILAIDLGTTNIKSILFDLKGNSCRESSHNLTTLNPAPDCSEQNPEEVIAGTIQTIRELNINSGTDILCVVLSGAMHSIFPIDVNGKPLSNALLWSDLRSSDIAKALKSTGLGRQLHHETGTPIHPMSPLCKLIWIREYLPELFVRAYKFISLKEYLIYQLTGHFVIDQSIASSTGLMNLTKKRWSDKALRTAGIKSSQLSDLRQPSYSLPLILDELRDIPLILGAADGCLANLGSGVIDQTQVALTIGTSAALRTTMNKPALDQQLCTFCYYVDDKLYISGGASNNGGNVFQWLTEKYKVTEYDIASASPGSNGLVTLPYVFGERAPFWETGMSSLITGQDNRHTSNDIARSFIEGICFNLLLISQSIGDFDRIIASGGFTKSSFWPQMVADVFNKPLQILQTGENTALGAAFLAMKASGIIQNYAETSELIQISQTFYPDRERNGIYADSFQKFNDLLEAGN